MTPYAVGKIGEATVYKLVHEGCEIYVVREYVAQVKRADSTAVAIATGRGCR